MKNRLFEAIQAGDVSLVRDLLHKGANANLKTADDMTALHLAVAMNQPGMIPLLVQHGADLNAKRKPAETPLLAALSLRHLQCAIVLVQLGADVKVRDGYMQDTPLHRAVYTDIADKETLKCIQEILNAGAKIDARNMAQETPLHYASRGALECVRLLLKHGASVHALDILKRIPLHDATARADNVRVLLAEGSDPDCADKFGRTPLFLAVERHVPEVVQQLIRAGANVNHKIEDGSTPLSRALQENQNQICEILLKAGATEDFSSQSLDLLLCNACSAGDVSRVREFLSRGASPNATHDWKSALMLAAENSNADVVNALLEAGADVRGSGGQSALQRAAGKGNHSIVRKLLIAGVEPDAPDSDGDTALLSACENGDTRTIRLLLDAGADPNHKSKGGMTALLTAARYGNAKAVEQIQKSGGKHSFETHFLEIPEFEERLKRPPITKMVTEISKLCGTKPMKAPHLFRSGVFWDLSKTDLAKKARQTLFKRYQDKKYFVKGTSPDAIRAGADRMSEMHAVDAAICIVQQRMSAKIQKRGGLLLFVHQLPGNKLALLPTRNPLAAVAWLGPHPKGPVVMLQYLIKLAKEWRWNLIGCSYDELRLQFHGKLQRRAALAKRLFGLRSDERGVVKDGQVILAETKKHFEQLLSTTNPVVRLWWD